LNDFEEQLLGEMFSLFGHAQQSSNSDLEFDFASAFFTVTGQSLPSKFLVSYSGSSFVSVLSTLFRQNRQSVALLEPCFDNIRHLLLSGGVAVSSVSEEDVREGERPYNNSILWITSPNNPTGWVLGRSELDRVARRCAERKVTLVIDCCFRFYSRDMAHWDMYQLLNESGCSYIVLEDTGKTLPLLDLKVSMLCMSGAFEDVLSRLNEELLLCVSPVLLKFLSEVLRYYASRGLRATLWDKIERNRAVVNAYVSQYSFLIDRTQSDAVPFSWVEIQRGGHRAAYRLAEAARTEGVHVLSGENFFWSTDEGAKYLRVALSREHSVVAEGMKRLDRVFRAFPS